MAACRFFNLKREYQAELQLYQEPVLRQILPKLLDATDNASGDVRSRSGFVFPPFLVLERGMTLQHWAEQARGFGEVVSMVERLASLLEVLHASGRVHRDMKPGAPLARLACVATALQRCRRLRVHLCFPCMLTLQH